MLPSSVHEKEEFQEYNDTCQSDQNRWRYGYGLTPLLAMFNGGIYYHSNAAHNLLSTMRIGVIRGGSEVEIWKRNQAEGNKYIRDESGQHITRAGEQVTKMPTPIPTADVAWSSLLYSI